MKKLISLISAASLALGMNTAVFAADIQVTVEGTPVAWTDAKPFIDENSRTLVPLRPIANALGLTVAWNDDTNTAAFTDGEGTLEFTVGSNKTHSFLFLQQNLLNRNYELDNMSFPHCYWNEISPTYNQ